MNITTDIPNTTIEGTLIDAFETSACTHWVRRDRDADEESGEPFAWPKDLMRLIEGGDQVCHLQTVDGERVRLTHNSLVRGIQLMAADHPRHYSDMVSECGDIVTADVLLQLATMGEVVYG